MIIINNNIYNNFISSKNSDIIPNNIPIYIIRIRIHNYIINLLNKFQRQQHYKHYYNKFINKIFNIFSFKKTTQISINNIQLNTIASTSIELYTLNSSKYDFIYIYICFCFCRSYIFCLIKRTCIECACLQLIYISFFFCLLIVRIIILY